MYQTLIGEKVTVVVSSRGDNILEYIGTLVSEDENNLELVNVSISFLMLNFQRGLFGSGLSKYKDNVKKTIINKRYVISCDR